MKRLRRTIQGRRDDGATAVEFALVVPILLLLVFGIIEYGLWFSDSLSTRQGVREAARQGVVANFGDVQQLWTQRRHPVTRTPSPSCARRRTASVESPVTRPSW